MYLALLRFQEPVYMDAAYKLFKKKQTKREANLHAVCCSGHSRFIGFLCGGEERHDWERWISHCYGAGLASITLFREADAQEEATLLAEEKNGFLAFGPLHTYYSALLKVQEEKE